MAAEEVLQLFETYWFQYQVFGTRNTPKTLQANDTGVEDCEDEAQRKPSQDQETGQVNEEEIHESKISRFSTIQVRSFSDLNLTSNTSSSSDFLSPNSVLNTPKLQPILSGKEVVEFPCEDVKPEETKSSSPVKPRGIEKKGGRRRKKGGSRSLSELEFEELKGFMDLGFVFSEEDKDSSLASIIPGLQRLGKKEKEEKVHQETVVSRPYLSEAWDVLDQRNVEFPLMNWRIPALGTEVDMKDQLRFWVHTVASTVR